MHRENTTQKYVMRKKDNRNKIQFLETKYYTTEKSFLKESEVCLKILIKIIKRIERVVGKLWRRALASPLAVLSIQNTRVWRQVSLV